LKLSRGFPHVFPTQTSDPRLRRVSDGVANANGFSDLPGNVAEWLDAGSVGGDSVPVAGGSFSDVPDAAAPLPVAMRPRTDRSRSTGFRFVVEGRWGDEPCLEVARDLRARVS
jgi:hypothetical protein